MRRLNRRRFVISVGATLGTLTALAACDGASTSDPDGGNSDADGGDGDGDADGGDGDGDGDGYSPGPEPASPWNPGGAVDLNTFPAAVQVGDVLPTAALLSVQTGAEAVDLAVAEGTVDGWTEIHRDEALVAEEGHVALELTDLKPDTTYSVYFANGTNRSEVARFRTALPAGASRVVRFGATSCLGGNVPWPNLSSAAGEVNDFFLLLGDTIYADGYENEELRPLWGYVLAQQGMRDVCTSTSLIATWDDHEVNNNYQVGVDLIREDVARDEFRRHIPQRVDPRNPRLYRKLSWGATLDVLVLDCRSERVGGKYISDEQMAWLKDELSSSTARFKIIANSVPITTFEKLFGGTLAQEDRWQGYPAQRNEILSHIADNEIAGVLWMTGDVHLGGIWHVDPAGKIAEAAWEVSAGPAGSDVNGALGAVMNEANQFPVVIREFNSVVVECDPDAGTCVVRHHGDGGVINEATLNL